MNRTRAATIGLGLPATMALGMSADTSYRFLGEHLGITAVWERGLLCGVAEAAILALSVYSWATRAKGAAYLAYAIVLVQAVPAFEVSSVAGGIARVALGPVLLATMLHLLLGLELRMSGARPDSVLRSAMREARERLTAYLGIGRRGADSAAIARSRAGDRAVVLADLVASVTPGSRRHRSRTARLAAAIDDARHGLDPEEADYMEALIVGRIIRRKSVADLATIQERHNWTSTLYRPAPLDNHLDVTPEEVDSAPAEVEEVTAPAGTTGWTKVDQAPEIPQVSKSTNRPGQDQTGPERHLQPVRGATAQLIRAAIQDGVMDTPGIRARFAEAGLPTPDTSYIRRLVRAAQDAPPEPWTGQYM